MSPRASVIIVAYNSGEHLQRALDALDAQTFRDFEIILFDNASEDGGAQSARLPENARLVLSPDNLGFAGGNNRAASESAAEFLVLLNPDAFPEPEWLERLVAAADRWPEAASIGSLQRDDANPDILDGAGDVMHIAGIAFRGGFGSPAPEALEPGEIFGPCAAAALYRRAAFEAAGGFDERFFCYMEDVDLAWRLRWAGWTAMLEPAAVVRHVGSATLGRRSRRTVYWGTRNRLWTLIKNTPARLIPVMVPFHLVILSVLLARDLLTNRQAFIGALAGLRDGVAGWGEAWRARKMLRRARTASAGEIARALCWSPLTLARRGVHIRRP